MNEWVKYKPDNMKISLIPITIVIIFFIININIGFVNSVAAANPKSFTDDPFIDDEKFMEKGIKYYFLDWMLSFPNKWYTFRKAVEPIYT